MPNRIKLLMASNNDWCVPVSEDERRYLVLDVSELMRGHHPYFTELEKAIDNGEAAAFLHFLLALDISDFEHRDVPHTAGLNGQKVEGLDSVGRWWMSCLSSEYIVGGVGVFDVSDEFLSHREWPVELGKYELHRAYVTHSREFGERHPKAENAFPRALARYAPSLRDYRPNGNKPRRWQFRSLTDHREEFLRVMKIDEHDWGGETEGEERQRHAESVQ